MKKTKYRRLAAMAASLLCCLIFTVPAYAQSSEPQPETASAPAETEAEPETQNPFTPDGTGTVVDNATDEDGKELVLEFVDALEYNGQMYQAFFPAETEGENEDDPDNGLVILKVIHEDGEDLLSTLDSDEELEAVYEQFMELLFDEDEE